MNANSLFSRSTILLACLILLGSAGFAWGKDLEAIKKAGVLRHLGIPYAHFVSGAGDGMDVELAQLFAKEIGVQYQYVKTDWATVVPDLIGRAIKVTGAEVTLAEQVPVKGDMIANGFTIIPWRQKAVAFSAPTFPSQIWLIARADSPVQPIKPTGDISQDIAATRSLMSGKKVLALAKTCLDPALNKLSDAGALVADFQGQLNDLAPALINNKAEMTILDVPDALIALGKWPGQLKIIGPVSPKQEMAAAFAKDAPNLLAAYNVFLAKAKQDGTYLRLVNKYYPSARLYFPEFFQGMR